MVALMADLPDESGGGQRLDRSRWDHAEAAGEEEVLADIAIGSRDLAFA
jgi:hypothetical protein